MGASDEQTEELPRAHGKLLELARFRGIGQHMLARVARTLVLIRHAKAASPEGVADHGRPLADRGRRDAPEAGRWLRSHGVAPQLTVVSGALRTRETYELVSAELETPPAERITDDAYYAGSEQLLDLIRALPPDTSSAMLIAHNPGIGTLARALDDGASAVADTSRMRAGFPTSSVAVFAVEGAWADLDPGTARLTGFTVARG